MFKFNKNLSMNVCGTIRISLPTKSRGRWYFLLYIYLISKFQVSKLTSIPQQKNHKFQTTIIFFNKKFKSLQRIFLWKFFLFLLLSKENFKSWCSLPKCQNYNIYCFGKGINSTHSVPNHLKCFNFCQLIDLIVSK